jgi:hypothetical protein
VPAATPAAAFRNVRREDPLERRSLVLMILSSGEMCGRRIPLRPAVVPAGLNSIVVGAGFSRPGIKSYPLFAVEV